MVGAERATIGTPPAALRGSAVTAGTGAEAGRWDEQRDRRGAGLYGPCAPVRGGVGTKSEPANGPEGLARRLQRRRGI
ncbi:hypothetical protein NDU88_004676 [Pleurodeles waltl]|uniref:Uncharacterized protein n=1 Tax=Pleurodeles waltl TaxID=8319 RepID=A0AAV7LJ08_PLEWA|nr:hypothetical protein NDU88_004676 [Pleurodeles waltl]